MYQRILVGTDGSSTAAKAVDRAAAVAEATGATLTIMSAGVADKAGKVVEQERRRVERPGLTVDTEVVQADPASAIVDAAESGHYDLVVVGNKGMTGARRFFTLGSVPNKVSHHLATSLLIVRTT